VTYIVIVLKIMLEKLQLLSIIIVHAKLKQIHIFISMGPEGRPGWPGNYFKEPIHDNNPYTAIENCTWCGVNEPYD
jgi:hypothetical protein